MGMGVGGVVESGTSTIPMFFRTVLQFLFKSTCRQKQLKINILKLDYILLVIE